MKDVKLIEDVVFLGVQDIIRGTCPHCKETIDEFSSGEYDCYKCEKPVFWGDEEMFKDRYVD